MNKGKKKKEKKAEQELYLGEDINRDPPHFDLSFKDRRSSVREKNVRFIWYKVLNGEDKDAEKRYEGLAISLDIGEGGLSIETRDLMTVGQMVMLEMFFAKELKLKAKARVVYAEYKYNNNYQIGLKLIEYSKDELKKVLDAIGKNSPRNECI